MDRVRSDPPIEVAEHLTAHARNACCTKRYWASNPTLLRHPVLRWSLPSKDSTIELVHGAAANGPDAVLALEDDLTDIWNRLLRGAPR